MGIKAIYHPLVGLEPFMTPFQQTVYAAVSRIPKGRVTTYGLLGKAIGCASAQAIGQALKNNPFAPKVPCHRVVSSDLSIGGFCGQRSGPEIERKIRLLKKEGVTIRNGHVPPEAVYTFRPTSQPR